MDSIDYLNREQIVEKLYEEGFDVSVRTLRFWESEGMIPSAEIIGGNALHNRNVLKSVRVLAATSPKALAKFRRNGASNVQLVELTDDEIVLRISYKKEKRND